MKSDDLIEQFIRNHGQDATVSAHIAMCVAFGTAATMVVAGEMSVVEGGSEKELYTSCIRTLMSMLLQLNPRPDLQNDIQELSNALLACRTSGPLVALQ